MQRVVAESGETLGQEKKCLTKKRVGSGQLRVGEKEVVPVFPIQPLTALGEVASNKAATSRFKPRPMKSILLFVVMALLACQAIDISARKRTRSGSVFISSCASNCNAHCVFKLFIGGITEFQPQVLS